MRFMKRGLKRVGAVPFGFDLEKGQLVPNPEEIGTVKVMVGMRRKGASYQKIAEHLKRGKVAAKNGGKWHPKTVMGVVTHLDSLPGDHWVMRKYCAEKGDKGNEK